MCGVWRCGVCVWEDGEDVGGGEEGDDGEEEEAEGAGCDAALGHDAFAGFAH